MSPETIKKLEAQFAESNNPDIQEGMRLLAKIRQAFADHRQLLRDISRGGRQ